MQRLVELIADKIETGNLIADLQVKNVNYGMGLICLMVIF